ncbi:ATP synthase F0 subunit B [bacterium]|nr:ATP synthase F0 subunit B [bacterium]
MLSVLAVTPHIQLIPDWTVFIQIAIFIAVTLVLNLLVFKPIVKILKRRHEATSGAMNYASELEEKAEGKLKDYELRIKQAMEEARTLKESIRREGEIKRDELLTKTRHEIADIFKETKENIQKESLLAEKRLEEKIEMLSIEIAEKILEREI